MDIKFARSITVEEFNFIRASVGFRQFHPEQAMAEIDGSTQIISAYHQEKIIAMARLSWCGGVSAFIYSFIVPEYKNYGIEEMIVDMLFEYLKSQLKPGFGIQVDVNAFGKSQIEMYQSIGFKIPSIGERGVRMHICLTDEIELTDRMYKQMEYRE